MRFETRTMTWQWNISWLSIQCSFSFAFDMFLLLQQFRFCSTVITRSLRQARSEMKCVCVWEWTQWRASSNLRWFETSVPDADPDLKLVIPISSNPFLLTDVELILIFNLLIVPLFLTKNSIRIKNDTKNQNSILMLGPATVYLKNKLCT